MVTSKGLGLWMAISAAIAALAVSGASAERIWDLEAVDADGVGIHPKVGADPTDPANRVCVEGIVLNGTGEYLDPNIMYTIFIQGEGQDPGGIQVWAGIFYNPDWPRYPDVQAGDRVRVEGFAANYNGKVFINERHSASPDLQFTVTVLDHPGMPVPIVIPWIAEANYFDPTRSGGGEKYQTHWCRINNVWIVEGNWGANESLTIADGTGQLTLKLSGRGDFDSFDPPAGKFHVIGVFDQEDSTLPWHENYRIWTKMMADIIPATPGDADGDDDVDVFDAIALVQAFGSQQGDPNWDPHCDFDISGGVDVFDVIALVNNFGAGY